MEPAFLPTLPSQAGRLFMYKLHQWEILWLFSLSQKTNQCMSSVISSCQKHSTELSIPDGRFTLLHSRQVSLTVLHYDDKHLPSWAPCTLVGVTGSPVCCSCAAPGSHPICNTTKQGTSALPVDIGLVYFPLTVGLMVLWKGFHAFICSTDISCASKAVLVLGLVQECNLCRGIRSIIHSSSSRAAGNRIHETVLARDKIFVTRNERPSPNTALTRGFSLNLKIMRVQFIWASFATRNLGRLLLRKKNLLVFVHICRSARDGQNSISVKANISQTDLGLQF